jgi:hypothetical protein
MKAADLEGISRKKAPCTAVPAKGNNAMAEAFNSIPRPN